MIMRMCRVLWGSVVLVAASVALAGCGGGSVDKPAYVEPAGPAVETLDIEAGNLWFKPDDIEAPAGILAIDLKNTESGYHTFVIRGIPLFELEVTGAGDTDVSKVQLSPKKYEFYCTVPGHAEAGMKGTLTVAK